MDIEQPVRAATMRLRHALPRTTIRDIIGGVRRDPFVRRSAIWLFAAASVLVFVHLAVGAGTLAGSAFLEAVWESERLRLTADGSVSEVMEHACF